MVPKPRFVPLVDHGRPKTLATGHQNPAHVYKFYFGQVSNDRISQPKSNNALDKFIS